jgi:tetratricopeptide (TPR) repeat protein
MAVNSRLVWLAAALGCSLVGPVMAQQPGAGLDEANARYQQRDYAGARQAYEALLQQDGPRVNVLYNLGNACQQTGELGWAIVYYEQALLAAPRDGDLRANLNAALAARRTAGSGAVPGTLSVVTRAVLTRSTLDELAGGAAALYLVGAALALSWLRAGSLRRRLRWALYGALVLAVLVGGLAVAKARTDHDPARAVVVADAQLLSGPADSFGVIRRAYQGETGRVVQRQGVWREVQLESGARGWVMQSAVASPVPVR